MIAAIALACGAFNAWSPTKPYASFKRIITPTESTAQRMVPTICHCSIFLGVAPVMCATLSSDIKLPAIPMVVPMKDAIMRTAIIPTLPVIPAAVKHTAEMIIMKIVIPDTGSVPV